MNKKELIVEKSKKIVQILQDFGFSYGDACKLMRNKDVKVDGQRIKDNILVQPGQVVTVFFEDGLLEKKCDKVFEDDDVLIVFKHAGIETDGENGLSSVLKLTAVHRLDRNTEGLVMFAKNEKAAKLLEKAIKNRQIHKFYLAEVVGEFKVDGTFNAFLVKDAQKAEVKIFDKPQKDALPISTKIKTLKSSGQSSILQVELLTGRTHQIRAHLAYLGHPIVGDGKYGKNETNKKFHENRQKLACFCLKFDFVGIEGLNFQQFEMLPSWAYFKPSI